MMTHGINVGLPRPAPSGMNSSFGFSVVGRLERCKRPPNPTFRTVLL